MLLYTILFSSLSLSPETSPILISVYLSLLFARILYFLTLVLLFGRSLRVFIEPSRKTATRPCQWPSAHTHYFSRWSYSSFSRSLLCSSLISSAAFGNSFSLSLLSAHTHFPKKSTAKIMNEMKSNS